MCFNKDNQPAGLVNEKSHRIYLYFLLLLLTFFSIAASAQNTIVTGIVTDATTSQPLPFIIVSFPGTSIGTNSNNNGKYAITTAKTFTQLKFSFVGYKSVVRTIIAGKEQVINVRMQPDVQALATVNIKSGKKPHYTNKENPAVELIRQVIAHKNSNRMESYDYTEYLQYEKLQFSLINVSDELAKKNYCISINFFWITATLPTCQANRYCLYTYQKS